MLDTPLCFLVGDIRDGCISMGVKGASHQSGRLEHGRSVLWERDDSGSKFLVFLDVFLGAPVFSLLNILDVMDPP